MRRLLAAFACAASLFPAAARAEETAGKGGAKSYSRYERETIDRAVAAVNGAVDPSPEGKVVERVDVVTLDVLEDRDPLPAFLRRFLNWFHVTSRKGVIEREVLVSVGDRYDQALVDETARNLRSIGQLSLVLCIALRGSGPERVRLLVITKDVWSLRLNSNFRVAGGRLEYLLLQPSEENLLGTHQTIAGQLTLDRAAYSLGGRYVVPRMAGSRVLASIDAHVIVNRGSGEAEGSFGRVAYGQPLYSTQAEWSWGSVVEWRDEVTRRFCSSDGTIPCADDGTLATFDAEATPADDRIPFFYDSDELAGAYFVTRSYGTTAKHDLTLSLELDRNVFRTGDLSAFDAAAAAEFVRREVPVSDTRVGPAFEYRTRSTRFMQVLDCNTLGLQEDVLLGHDARLKLYPVTTVIGSSRDYVGISAAALYSFGLGDGVARAYVESITELDREGSPNASVEVGGRVMTPSLPVGRLVFDARMLSRYQNALNRQSTLGGETRLRGYPTAAFRGKDVVSGNLEFRTKPLEILTVQLGAAAFFDTGDAFDGWNDLRPKQSAGFGLRILFPQLDRVVLRADWGFPVTPGYLTGPFPGDIILTFRQAFPMPAL